MMNNVESVGMVKEDVSDLFSKIASEFTNYKEHLRLAAYYGCQKTTRKFHPTI